MPRDAQAYRLNGLACFYLIYGLAFLILFGSPAASAQDIHSPLARTQEMHPDWIAHPFVETNPSRDVTVDIEVTDEGHTYLLGRRSRSPFGIAHVLIKLDRSGEEVWKMALDSYPTTRPIALEVDGDGNAYVVSQVQQFSNQLATLLMKYSAATGGVAWVRKFDDWGATGSFVAEAGGSVFVELRRGVGQSDEAMILRLDPKGQEVWSRVTAYDGPTPLAADHNGGLFALRGRQLIYTNPAGTVTWTRENVIPNPISTRVKLKLAGDLYAVGSAHGFFYARIDPATGETISTGQHPQGYAAADFAVGPDESVYVIGYTLDQRTCKDECRDDYITAKFDASGDVVWSARHDSVRWIGEEYPTSIALVSDASAVVTGISDGVTTIGYDAATGTEQWLAHRNGHSPLIASSGAGDVFLTWVSDSEEGGADLSAARLLGTSGEPLWRYDFDGPKRARGHVRGFNVGEDGSSVLVGNGCEILHLDAAGNVSWTVGESDLPAVDCRITNVLRREDGALAVVVATAAEESDLVVALIESSGRVMWTRTQDDPGEPRAGYVRAALADDGFVVLSSNLVGGYYELFAVRYDWDGRQLWRTHVDPEESISTRAFEVRVRDQTVLVLGTIEKAAVNEEVAVMNLSDDTGEARWIRLMGGDGPSGDNPVGMGVGPDRSVLVLGELRDSVGATTSEARNVLVRYGSSGDSLWSASAGDQKPVAMESDPEGNSYVISLSNRSDDPWQDADLIYHIRKFDREGRLTWVAEQNTGPGSVMESPSLRFIDGHLWIVGSLRHALADYRQPAVWILDAEGDVSGFFWLSPHTYPMLRLAGVGVDRLGNVYVGGGLDGAPTVVKYSSAHFPVASEPTPLPRETRVDAPFPNPASDRISFPIELSKPAHVSIRIADVLGRTVIRTQPETQQPGRRHESIDVTTLASGVYMYVLDISGERFAGPLVIAR